MADLTVLRAPTWSKKRGVAVRMCKGLILSHNDSRPVVCGGTLLFFSNTETHYIFRCDRCERDEFVKKPRTPPCSQSDEQRIACPS